MRRFWKQGVVLVVLAVAVGLWCLSPSLARPPGGGGSGASYSIVDLPGPYHQADGNWSYTYAERISDPSASGTVYVLGFDNGPGTAGVPCLWAVDAAGNVLATDISLSLGTANDVNSAGIVGGQAAGRPALLLSDLSVVFLSATQGQVQALNNPNAQGVFQAVGLLADGSGAQSPVLWRIDGDGALLATTPLITVDGQKLFAWDINDAGAMAGVVVEAGSPVATIGRFVNNQLQLTYLPNPNPAEIVSYWDVQIDENEDVLGFGVQNVLIDGWLTATLSRAVIWPAAGGAIDLGAETGIASTEGNGIASVKGVMQVVGRAEDDGRSAFAYRYANNKLQDLNTLAKADQPWNLAHGEGVNRSGMICGFGKVGGRRTGQWHGFLLIPTQP